MSAHVKKVPEAIEITGTTPASPAASRTSSLDASPLDLASLDPSAAASSGPPV
jgi:hypothetical protein